MLSYIDCIILYKMGLFGKKKSRKKEKGKEEINIKIVNENDILFDTSNEDLNNTETEKPIEVVKTDLINIFNIVIKNNKKITHEYYISKILSRVGLKDLDFNSQVIMMDKHVNRMKRDCFNLTRTIENIKSGLQIEENELRKIYKQVFDLQAFQNGVLHQLTEINNNSYSHLKISTVTITINKTNEELETLFNNINTELKGSRNFEEAAEYIYYNSGGFIDNLVDSYVEYVKASKNEEYINQYTRYYFLESDVIISMEIKEWIELYKKLKFVLKLMNSHNNNLYLNCYKLFNIFEAKYAILMMREEQNKQNINIWRKHES